MRRPLDRCKVGSNRLEVIGEGKMREGRALQMVPLSEHHRVAGFDLRGAEMRSQEKAEKAEYAVHQRRDGADLLEKAVE